MITKKIVIILSFFIFNLTAQANDALDGIAEELEAPAESVMIESFDLGGGQCEDWVKDTRKWSLGENTKNKDGSTFTVQVGSSVIAAPPGHPNYINSRQNAYVKAMLNAKSEIVKSMGESISREVLSSLKEGEFGADKQSEKESEKNAQEGDKDWKGALNKSLKLINAELDERLVDKGINPNPNTPQEKEELQKEAEAIINSSSFAEIIKSSAKARMKGVRRVYVAEEALKGEQGQICVVALVSGKTMAMADAIFSGDFSIAPKGKYGKPLKQSIPNHKTNAGLKTLLSSFGTEMLRDEKGNFHLVAYAQVGPRSKTKTSMSNAVKVALQRAKGAMRSYAQEYAMVDTANENSESAQELANEMQNYEYNNALETTLKSISSPIEIKGLSPYSRWAAKHPITGQLVVGVVLKWAATTAEAGDRLKKEMSRSAEPVVAGVRGKEAEQKFGQGAYSTGNDYKGEASGGSDEDDF